MDDSARRIAGALRSSPSRARFREGIAQLGFGLLLSLCATLGSGCQPAPSAHSVPSAQLRDRDAAHPAAAVSPPASTVSSPAPAPDPVLPHQTFTIDSRLMAETRRMNLYLPPGYVEAGGARYPVLYMPDGGVEEDFPHVTNDVDAAVRAGEMEPVIVVGIENTERRRDMTGPTEVETDRQIAPRVGGSAKFRAFLRDELMPEIRRRVRGDGRTAIVGESLAGLFVVETFFEEPRLFDTYIALSPSLWWNSQALVRGAEARFRAQPGITATLYLAVAGDDDRGDAVKGLAAVLRAAAPKGLTWYFEPRTDQQHSTIYRAASPGAFRKLFPPARKTAPPAK